MQQRKPYGKLLAYRGVCVSSRLMRPLLCQHVSYAALVGYSARLPLFQFRSVEIAQLGLPSFSESSSRLGLMSSALASFRRPLQLCNLLRIRHAWFSAYVAGLWLFWLAVAHSASR